MNATPQANRYTILFLIISAMAIYATYSYVRPESDQPKKNESVKEEQKQSASSESETEEKNQELTTKQKIEKNILSISDKLLVTVKDKDGKFVMDSSAPPFDVNVATSEITNCDSAKRMAFETMAALYGDESIKNSLSRVKFSAFGLLVTSVGSSDGPLIDWKITGPTNYFTVMERTRMQPNEDDPLSERTYGLYLSKECE